MVQIKESKGIIYLFIYFELHHFNLILNFIIIYIFSVSIKHFNILSLKTSYTTHHLLPLGLSMLESTNCVFL
jgi:hypothetical protein